MNPKTLQSFKIRLEAERDAALSAHEDHETSLRESHTGKDIAGPDRAAEIIEANVEAHIVESEELLLQKITHALTRIEEGTYGVCEVCSETIPASRLDAKPSVSLCVTCQESKESV